MSIKGYIFSVILYMVILFSILQSSFILAGVSIIVFSIKYSSYALIPMAIVFDGYFGAFYEFPLLSCLAIVWCGCVELLRPKIFIVQS